MKFSFNMLYFIKKQYFKTQLINTEHRTQDTDTGLRTQTHAKNIHDLQWPTAKLSFLNSKTVSEL